MTNEDDMTERDAGDEIRREQVSALIDGQLRGADLASVIDGLCVDLQLRELWSSYHLCGDLLRSPDLLFKPDPSEFLLRLRQSLQSEPALMPVAPDEAAGVGFMPAQGAANEGQFRWKLVAGLASLMALAAVGWSMNDALLPQPARLAQLSAPALGSVAAERGNAPENIMIRDAHLDDLLAAHKQFGGASALQAPAGFLRNATFEMPSR